MSQERLAGLPCDFPQLKVLYLRNDEGWAIHKVGILWLSGNARLSVTIRDGRTFRLSDCATFDVIWFGYLDLFVHYYLRSYFRVAELRKCIVSIHDPEEIFPQREDWKRRYVNQRRWWSASFWDMRFRLRTLRSVGAIITTSKEMHAILQQNGVANFILPTTSSLPARDRETLKTERCSAVSIFAPYPRKNVALLESLKSYCQESLALQFDVKIGRRLLPTDEYIDFLDDHEVYICTSFQEGGPIPAMDAMQRGCVVLSTPVGQMPELIIDGRNGYICGTREDFVERLAQLAADLELLHAMRVQSSESIRAFRDIQDIKRLALSVVEQVCAFNESASYSSGQTISVILRWLCLSTIGKMYRGLKRARGLVPRELTLARSSACDAAQP